MRRSTNGWLLTVTLLAAGCAHGAQTIATPTVDVNLVWPAPPAAPRVRLARILETRRAPAERSFFRRLVDGLIGAESRPEADRTALRRPFGLTRSPAGDLLVADPDARAVFRVAADGGISTVECPDRAWDSPMAVTYAFGAVLAVADAGTPDVVLVDSKGSCRSVGSGEFLRPTGLAAGGGLLYVVDPPRHDVVVLTADGTVLRRIGSRGSGDGQLSFPAAVTVASDRTLFVVDTMNFRVSHFTGDGRWIGSFGGPGDVDGRFARPKGIATSADGTIFVTDAQRDMVLVFSADGTFEYSVGSPGAEAGHFQSPSGLWVVGRQLLVADSLNARIQIFEVLGGST